MANLSKVGTPVPCSDIPQSNKLTLPAGEGIEAGDTLYIKSDGKFWKASGAAVAAAADFYGLATQAASAGDACTAAFGCRFRYGSGLTPGTLIYLSTDTAGGLADANATVTKPVARAVTADRIQVFDPFDERTTG